MYVLVASGRTTPSSTTASTRRTPTAIPNNCSVSAPHRRPVGPAALQARPEARYGALEPVLRASVDVALIVEQWDQLVRVAASMKHRSAKTHDVMQRLVNASPADRLAKALTALGRAVKTTYLLRYIQDGDLRSRVQLQLNRGEGRHHLAKHLFWSQRGEFHRGDLQEVMSKASCLGLLSNAVIAWYVVEMDRIVATLRQAGPPRTPTCVRCGGWRGSTSPPTACSASASSSSAIRGPRKDPYLTRFKNCGQYANLGLLTGAAGGPG